MRLRTISLAATLIASLLGGGSALAQSAPVTYTE
ncbi:MAG: hypothetical protein JWO56_307, partial [Acidobacteria bacterium]|nr:hypothetical protein [Acidobacteriota bacterium]